MEETLYVVQQIGHDETVSPGPEIEEVREILASDIDWLLVESYDHGTLERIVSKYPGWCLSLANGEFVDIGGAEFAVEDGRLIES
jgi:hypothetical protein